jgi:hypothetical protein
MGCAAQARFRPGRRSRVDCDGECSQRRFELRRRTQRGDRMRVELPASLLLAGASNDPIGTHTSKTMMLPELRLLLAAVPGPVAVREYTRAAVEDNALRKNTTTTRKKTLSMLRQLYGLSGDVPIFAALRGLWDADPYAQPLLALSCATARDPLLRATAHAVLTLQPCDHIGPAELAAEVASAFPNRYKPGTLHHIGQNTGASWTQGGLLRGRLKKERVRPHAVPIAAVYALYLGHLGGLAGPALLTSIWAKLCDTDTASVRSLAETAARSGWLEYASSGGMTEIGFRHLDDLTGWTGF